MSDTLPRKRTFTAGELREALLGVPDDVEVWVNEPNGEEFRPLYRVRASKVVDYTHDRVAEVPTALMTPLDAQP